MPMMANPRKTVHSVFVKRLLWGYSMKIMLSVLLCFFFSCIMCTLGIAELIIVG